MNNSSNITKLQTTLLTVAKERLEHACKVRNSDCLVHVTQGVILSELIMQYLPPAPTEKHAAAPAVKKTRAADALRVVAS